MKTWYMLTVIGRDRPGIVAELTAALFDAGATLGDASMLRMGSNFTIMLMVELDGDLARVHDVLDPVAERLEMRLHAVEIEPGLHQHAVPDVLVKVHGADRPGIVAQVVGALTEAGLNITDLESRVGGSADRPLYIMTVEGQAQQGFEALEAALQAMTHEGIELQVEPIDTLYG